MEIPLSEIAFHPLTGGDPDGRLFEWQGELYRGLNGRAADAWTNLQMNGLVHRLWEGGNLVRAEDTEFSIPGFKEVIKHPRIEPVAYPEEWSPPMLRAAAICTLELLSELVEEGFILRDANPWNILFEGYRPCHVDLTSIIPGDGSWPAFDEFRRFFVNPLILMAEGYDREARHLICSQNGATQADVSRMTQRIPDIPVPPGSGLNQTSRKFPRVSALKISQRLKPLFKAFWLGRSSVTLRESVDRLVKWIDLELGDKSYPLHSPKEGRGDRKWARNFLQAHQPLSVLDIGSQNGWFSCLCANEQVRTTVSFSQTAEEASALYLFSRQNRLRILSLLVDPSRMSRPGSLADWNSIEKRFRSEVVFVGQADKTIPSETNELERYLDGLSKLARSSLVFEFRQRDNREEGCRVKNKTTAIFRKLGMKKGSEFFCRGTEYLEFSWK